MSQVRRDGEASTPSSGRAAAPVFPATSAATAPVAPLPVPAAYAMPSPSPSSRPSASAASTPHVSATASGIEPSSSLRILIPGSVVGVSSAGFLTLRVPWSKAPRTTLAKLKRQTLTSIARKRARHELGPAVAPVDTPGATSTVADSSSATASSGGASNDLDDPANFALARLTRPAGGASGSEGGGGEALATLLDERQTLESVSDWKNMSLMLVRRGEGFMRVMLPSGTGGSQSQSVSVVATPALTMRSSADASSRRSDGMASSFSPGSSPWRGPASHAHASLGFSLSPSPLTSSAPSPALRAAASPFTSPTPLSGGSSLHSAASTSRSMSAAAYSHRGYMDEGGMVAPPPRLGPHPLDICICCYNGSYIRAALPPAVATASSFALSPSVTALGAPAAPAPALEVGPIASVANWACFDGVRGLVVPGARRSPTFKFLQNIHTRQWLAWKPATPASSSSTGSGVFARGEQAHPPATSSPSQAWTVELVPVLSDRCRWTVLKGKVQQISLPLCAGPAHPFAPGQTQTQTQQRGRWLLALTPSTTASSTPGLSRRSVQLVGPVAADAGGKIPAPPPPAQMKICFAVTQGVLGRRVVPAPDAAPAAAPAPGGCDRILPRFFVLTGSSLSYWSFPLSLLGTASATSVLPGQQGQGSAQSPLSHYYYGTLDSGVLQSVEKWTTGSPPLWTVSLGRVRTVTVLGAASRGSWRAGAGAGTGTVAGAAAIRVEYDMPDDGGAALQPTQHMELEVPESTSASASARLASPTSRSTSLSSPSSPAATAAGSPPSSFLSFSSFPSSSPSASPVSSAAPASASVPSWRPNLDQWLDVLERRGVTISFEDGQDRSARRARQRALWTALGVDSAVAEGAATPQRVSAPELHPRLQQPQQQQQDQTPGAPSQAPVDGAAAAAVAEEQEYDRDEEARATFVPQPHAQPDPEPEEEKEGARAGVAAPGAFVSRSPQQGSGAGVSAGVGPVSPASLKQQASARAAAHSSRPSPTTPAAAAASPSIGRSPSHFTFAGAAAVTAATAAGSPSHHSLPPLSPIRAAQPGSFPRPGSGSGSGSGSSSSAGTGRNPVTHVLSPNSSPVQALSLLQSQSQSQAPDSIHPAVPAACVHPAASASDSTTPGAAAPAPSAAVAAVSALVPLTNEGMPSSLTPTPTSVLQSSTPSQSSSSAAVSSAGAPASAAAPSSAQEEGSRMEVSVATEIAAAVPAAVKAGAGAGVAGTPASASPAAHGASSSSSSRGESPTMAASAAAAVPSTPVRVLAEVPASVPTAASAPAPSPVPAPAAESVHVGSSSPSPSLTTSLPIKPSTLPAPNAEGGREAPSGVRPADAVAVAAAPAAAADVPPTDEGVPAFVHTPSQPQHASQAAAKAGASGNVPPDQADDDGGAEAQADTAAESDTDDEEEGQVSGAEGAAQHDRLDQHQQQPQSPDLPSAVLAGDAASPLSPVNDARSPPHRSFLASPAVGASMPPSLPPSLPATGRILAPQLCEESWERGHAILASVEAYMTTQSAAAAAATGAAGAAGARTEGDYFHSVEVLRRHNEMRARQSAMERAQEDARKRGGNQVAARAMAALALREALQRAAADPRLEQGSAQASPSMRPSMGPFATSPLLHALPSAPPSAMQSSRDAGDAPMQPLPPLPALPSLPPTPLVQSFRPVPPLPHPPSLSLSISGGIGAAYSPWSAAATASISSSPIHTFSLLERSRSGSGSGGSGTFGNLSRSAPHAPSPMALATNAPIFSSFSPSSSLSFSPAQGPMIVPVPVAGLGLGLGHGAGTGTGSGPMHRLELASPLPIDPASLVTSRVPFSGSGGGGDATANQIDFTSHGREKHAEGETWAEGAGTEEDETETEDFVWQHAQLLLSQLTSPQHQQQHQQDQLVSVTLGPLELEEPQIKHGDHGAAETANEPGSQSGSAFSSPLLAPSLAATPHIPPAMLRDAMVPRPLYLDTALAPGAGQHAQVQVRTRQSSTSSSVSSPPEHGTLVGRGRLRAATTTATATSSSSPSPCQSPSSALSPSSSMSAGASTPHVPPAVMRDVMALMLPRNALAAASAAATAATASSSMGRNGSSSSSSSSSFSPASTTSSSPVFVGRHRSSSVPRGFHGSSKGGPNDGGDSDGNGEVQSAGSSARMGPHGAAPYAHYPASSADSTPLVTLRKLRDVGLGMGLGNAGVIGGGGGGGSNGGSHASSPLVRPTGMGLGLMVPPHHNLLYNPRMPSPIPEALPETALLLRGGASNTAPSAGSGSGNSATPTSPFAAPATPVQVQTPAQWFGRRRSLDSSNPLPSSLEAAALADHTPVSLPQSDRPQESELQQWQQQQQHQQEHQHQEQQQQQQEEEPSSVINHSNDEFHLVAEEASPLHMSHSSVDDEGHSADADADAATQVEDGAAAGFSPGVLQAEVRQEEEQEEEEVAKEEEEEDEALPPLSLDELTYRPTAVDGHGRNERVVEVTLAIAGQAGMYLGAVHTQVQAQVCAAPLSGDSCWVMLEASQAATGPAAAAAASEPEPNVRALCHSSLRAPDGAGPLYLCCVRDGGVAMLSEAQLGAHAPQPLHLWRVRNAPRWRGPTSRDWERESAQSQQLESLAFPGRFLSCAADDGSAEGAEGRLCTVELPPTAKSAVSLSATAADADAASTIRRTHFLVSLGVHQGYVRQKIEAHPRVHTGGALSAGQHRRDERTSFSPDSSSGSGDDGWFKSMFAAAAGLRDSSFTSAPVVAVLASTVSPTSSSSSSSSMPPSQGSTWTHRFLLLRGSFLCVYSSEVEASAAASATSSSPFTAAAPQVYPLAAVSHLSCRGARPLHAEAGEEAEPAHAAFFSLHLEEEDSADARTQMHAPTNTPSRGSVVHFQCDSAAECEGWVRVLARRGLPVELLLPRLPIPPAYIAPSVVVHRTATLRAGPNAHDSSQSRGHSALPAATEEPFAVGWNPSLQRLQPQHQQVGVASPEATWTPLSPAAAHDAFLDFGKWGTGFRHDGGGNAGPISPMQLQRQMQMQAQGQHMSPQQQQHPQQQHPQQQMMAHPNELALRLFEQQRVIEHQQMMLQQYHMHLQSPGAQLHPSAQGYSPAQVQMQMQMEMQMYAQMQMQAQMEAQAQAQAQVQMEAQMQVQPTRLRFAPQSPSDAPRSALVEPPSAPAPASAPATAPAEDEWSLPPLPPLPSLPPTPRASDTTEAPARASTQQPDFALLSPSSSPSRGAMVPPSRPSPPAGMMLICLLADEGGYLHSAAVAPTGGEPVCLELDLSERSTWSCRDASLVEGGAAAAAAAAAAASATAASRLSASHADTKVLQDNRGMFLCAAGPAAASAARPSASRHDNEGTASPHLYFSATLCVDALWRLHKKRHCQLLESAQHADLFLASDPDTQRVHLQNGAAELRILQQLQAQQQPFDPAAPAPRLDSIGAIRWRVCHARLQATLMQRVVVGGAHGGGSAAADSSKWMCRFCLLNTSALDCWSNADAAAAGEPALHSWPYSDIKHVLVEPAAPDPTGAATSTPSPAAARLDLTLSTGDRVCLRLESAWQQSVWRHALAAKHVQVIAKPNVLHP